MLSALSNDLLDVYFSYKKMKSKILLSSNTIKNVVRQRFVIRNYYCWKMIEDKDLKIQISEYYKLLEDIKAENIVLLNKFVSEVLIEKLLQYKQQLKYIYK